MFQLIVAIIAIVLVAALAAASVFYGGDAFTSGGAKAAAATIVNQGQQIVAAHTLYENDNAGAVPASVAALSPSYLESVPVAPLSASTATSAFALGTGVVTLQLDGTGKANICNKIAQQAAGDITATPTVVATVTAAAGPVAADLGTKQFNCVVDAATPTVYWFAYKN